MKIFTVTSAILHLPDDFSGDSATALRLMADQIDRHRHVPLVEFTEDEAKELGRAQFILWDSFIVRLADGGDGVGCMYLGDYDPVTRSLEAMPVRSTP